MTDILKPVVLISGCSTGIGRAMALEFAGRGCKVAATARKPAAMKNLESENISLYPLDVTNTKSIKACIKKVNSDLGRIDILVNNAGYALIGPVAELTMEDLYDQFKTNLFGLIELTQGVLPQMQERKSGKIVNISSVSGILTTPFGGAYCATKAALNSISDAMRLELAPFGINVITVQPGAVKSNFGNRASSGIDAYKSEGSLYSFASKYIEMRAVDSQNNPTKAEVFTAHVADRVLSENPPAIIRMGRLSFKLPFFKKFFPVNLLDSMLKKRYGLDVKL